MQVCPPEILVLTGTSRAANLKHTSVSSGNKHGKILYRFSNAGHIKCTTDAHLGVSKIADLQQRPRTPIQQCVFELDISASNTLSGNRGQRCKY